jgi:hypothetical protein
MKVPRVEAKWDPATNRISCEIPTTWDVIAQMVATSYADGKSHEQVTAWLDREIAQGWRDVLVEVVLQDGSKPKRWALPVEERTSV